MTAWVQPVSGEALLARADGVRRTYAEAFAGPPWHEDPAMADGYAERLARDAARPGFVAALALSRDGDGDGGGGAVVGFVTAWTTPAPFPADRGYARVAAALGAGRTADWLVGALEVDELALSPGARGSGLAAELLESVTARATEGRCWLLTSVRAEPAVRLYRRLGWRQALGPSTGSDVVVFLGPRHPGRPDTADGL
ncbi:GNAT family N-acetyltransferase [Streptomyces sp. NBC_00338]|uniref:GNAT family N-acetyltransferase n=1 Tax=Streptomyces sp. NBC_00338 TaxID=2975715 RepID=UPI00225C32E6|nr:GNAT family N-acetyltransferase [Streptomyces sp. NBC_00338]MCX5142563.1 GNAT family N-acetyltransferase [Streptomyces sp. NBC_00338]